MAWKELIDESKIGAAGGVVGIDSAGKIAVPVAGFDRDITVGDMDITKDDIGLGKVENLHVAGIFERLKATDIPDIGISQVTGLAAGLSDKVPTSRKVAGKALTADVVLAKGDVGLGNVENLDSAGIFAKLTGENIKAAGVKTSDLITTLTTLPASGNVGEIVMKGGSLFVWQAEAGG